MSRETRVGSQLGRSHPLLGRIRLLSRSPDERLRSGLMLAEGVHLAWEALAESARIHEAIVSPRLQRDPRAPDLLAQLRRVGVTVWHASDTLLDSLHEAESHQGILAVVERPRIPSAHLIPSEGRRALVLIACGVQDPGNMGALVRLADAAGASGMLAVGGADPFGPKAVRASAGSVFRLPVSRARDVSEAIALASTIRGRGGIAAGAIPRGGLTYLGADLSASLALFLGAEGAGLPDEVKAVLDLQLTIPMSPRVESLNVAAAAAILLFAAAGVVTTPPGPARPRDAGRPRRPRKHRSRRREPGRTHRNR